MWRWAVLIAAGVALSGCRLLDRPPRGRDGTQADPASRTKPAGGSWLDGPGPARTPPAGTWANPADPGFDVGREAKRSLAGWVEDPDGRKLRYVTVEAVEAAGPAGRAPMEVQTDPAGHFSIQGLEPDTPYQLTARSAVDGQQLAGRVYIATGQPRSQAVRIPLLAGLQLDDRPGRPPAPGKPADPAGSPPPVPAVVPSGGPAPRLDPPTRPDAPADDSPGRDRAWSPTDPGRRAAPSPPAADPGARPAAGRPDLSTEGPDGLGRPPAASIPGPPAERRSQFQPAKARPGGGFTLVDPAGGERAFPSGRPGELVLLDFMTTACLPCRQTLPALTALHGKYAARGLEVVGVACDDARPAHRRALASRYKDDLGLSFLVLTDPDKDPGRLMRRFKVEAFPTAVLLNGAGEVLWHGHPRDASGLERAILAGLGQ